MLFKRKSVSGKTLSILLTAAMVSSVAVSSAIPTVAFKSDKQMSGASTNAAESTSNSTDCITVLRTVLYCMRGTGRSAI